MPLDFDEMKSGLSRFLRSPWLGAAIFIAGGILLVVVARDLGDRLPQLPSIQPGTAVDQKTFPLAKIEALLAKESLAQIRTASNGAHAFFTRHFEPPPPKPTPPPAPAPEPAPVPVPPPAPTTRKAALLFQGIYEGAAGQKKAFVKVESELHILTPGTKVIADWSIADIGIRKLTLTNSSAQTNILEFNAIKELEVPIK